MTSPGTTDDKEIAQFNRLASTWWDSTGPMWPLHLLNRFRVQVILDVLQQRGVVDAAHSQPLNGVTALDIGCGGGILSESLARLGAQVTGLDMAENNVAIARQHAASSGLDIRYLHQEVDSLDERFDLVFNMEVVEHVANLDAFLAASCQRLAPGGTMFISTFNRTIRSYLIGIVGAEYILNLLPRGTHQWRKFVPPANLHTLLKTHNLDTVWQTGVSLNPFTKTYATTQSTAVSYMLAATHGGTSNNGSKGRI
ncbi:bifunctional 2-polyprenyl-6-hydroxyphenol methylase/3-demethylubiquinol 3-O-methyltransferase UbiG [Ketobacter sp.]|uniref:bifunctional 2-polyprenyl-6-hydroxyphenol methylase/3-demethylubiquinol 3-O-methyltransferase UbiG n=1 Tax=Ketobacter sp. TaxID=2083498 RepID=UPI000F1ABAE0|nr:bifunctional 2-polyprenyl-6-hydroxyphenol methylase/3-demethylubiquinol 3-O-methyltransferase UbiG [Ketobacter sp.]RLT97392.1 MAG: bifunctional 2-polyprenyl-6-hydroxyphenol methylase/3-demethylubiquinol 3-O-methyltransferase UbiG [Ketobacter sp.]